MVTIKSHIINLAVQKGKLQQLFPASSVSISANVLTWKHTLRPSPLGEEYQVKMIYKLAQSPNVFVISPQLRKRQKGDDFNHVYDEGKQWLCLYYKKAREWNSGMLLADIVVPWISEWLFHYEIWSVTGKWNGGGISHGTAKGIDD
ncbi:hypothetical protein [Sunxiuqinia elliptica]|uniref:Type II CBASS E2 protein domain-containing protein n=1 Tax=Sunxiuqinia elliptica TaxID=655355 RepID=A0A4R6HB56_9BACT|nr:hypothetical protein [Sunxiuqinia elliptica]TDO05394.1 hypothetical protein DET52_101754 [Sunxiuqinia elliptica]TDO64941.1 hypothetical protein DET65_1313 [Sunxiuqinia elliptica]